MVAVVATLAWTSAVVAIAAEVAADTEVELLLVMAVFAEVLPDDFGCAKGCMGPPCGATVIILPFFFVFVFLAAGSFDAAKINGNTDNFPYSTCLFFLCLWKFTIQRLS